MCIYYLLYESVNIYIYIYIVTPCLRYLLSLLRLK